MNKTLCLSLCVFALASFSANAASTPEEYSKEVTDVVTHQHFTVHDNESAPGFGDDVTPLKNAPVNVSEYTDNRKNVPVRACTGQRFYWMTDDGKYVVKGPFSNGSHSFWDSPDIVIGSPAFQQRLEKACTNPKDEFTKPMSELRAKFKKDLR